jgi:hypothetical protein
MKIKITITKILFMSLFFVFCQKSIAQSTEEKSPEWIKMMDDENVNYNQAVSNFNAYWEKREKPTEEEEVFNDKDFFKKQKSSTKKSKNIEPEKYSFEYKKFLDWKRSVAPYVQSDGRILSQQEQLEIWEQEKKNRN